MEAAGASAGAPTRRTVLTAGLLLPLAACTSGAGPGPTPAPDPDVALRAAAVARERDLLARYDAVVAAAPARSAVLLPLRAEHVVHLAVLGEAVASASPTPTVPVSPAVPSAAPPPGDPSPAALVAAEAAAAQAHAAAVATASRALGTTLATLAASEASHTVALA